MRLAFKKTRCEAPSRPNVSGRLLIPAMMVLSLAVAGCGKKFTGKTHVYTCADGTRVEVVYSKERDYARVRIGDATYELKQVPAASGTKYSRGEVVFWNKGRGALIQIGGEIIHEGCHLME